MSRLKKTLFITFLSLLIFISNVGGVFSLKAEGESPTNEETTKRVEDITDSKLTFTLLNSDNKVINDSNKISNGDGLIIRASFELPKSVTDTYLTIDLGELQYINVSNQTNIQLKSNKNNEIGRFDVISSTDDNSKTTYQIKIKFNYDQIKADAESFPYTCKVNVSGTLDLGDDAEPDNGEISLNIGGTSVNYPYKKADTKITTTKSSLGDGSSDDDGLKYVAGSTDDESYFYKKFKVELTSNGDNKNVQIIDTLDNANLEFVTTADETNGISAPTLKIGDKDESDATVSVDGTKMTTTVTDVNTALAKDATATLTYWVRFKKTKYSEVSTASNTAKATYTNNNNSDSTSNESTYTYSLGTPGIEKAVTKVDIEETNTTKLKWTITVTPCSYNDGYVITDSEVLSGDSTVSSSSRLTGAGVVKAYLSGSESNAWYLSYDNYKAGKLSLTSDSSTTEKGSESSPLSEVKINPNNTNIIIEYTNTYNVSDVNIIDGFNTKNTATIKNESLGISKDADAEYYFVPGYGLSIHKSYSSYNPSTGVITWKVEVIQPAEFSEVTLKDKPSGLTMNADLMVQKSTGLDASNNVTLSDAESASWVKSTTEEDVYTLTLSDATEYTGKVKDFSDYEAKYKKYVLTYSTTISGNKGISDASNKVGASYVYKSESKEFKYDSATYGNQNFLVLTEKTGEAVSSYSDKQNWSLKFDVDAMDFSESSNKTVTIKDVLPENMELIKGTFVLGSTSLSDSEISLSTSTDSGKQTFTADLTSALKTYKSSLDTITEDNKFVTLTYQTKFISVKKAYDNTVKGGEATKYTNTATATYDGNTITKTGTADCKFNPDDSVSKTFTYDPINTPNYINYTIEMNKGAAHLANTGETTLSVTDNAGKSLIYSESSIKVTADGTEINDYKVEILATASGSSMTISNLPDEKVIVIKYDCLINVPANTNTATISDGSVSNGISTTLADGVSFSKDTKVDKKIESADGVAYPTNATLKLTKVDYDDPTKKLSGAIYVAYVVVNDNGTLRKATPEDYPSYNLEPKYSAETDADGNTKITGMYYNLIYCVEEYKAPSGYSLSDDKIYVLYDGKNGETDTSTVISDSEIAGLNINHIYNFIGTYTTTVADKTSNDTPTTHNDDGGHVLTCEEYMKSKDWTWSEKTKTCVYRVKNTSTKDDD